MLQLKEALAYGSYMICTTFLPNAVNVVTLYYGEPSFNCLSKKLWLSLVHVFLSCSHENSWLGSFGCCNEQSLVVYCRW